MSSKVTGFDNNSTDDDTHLPPYVEPIVAACPLD